jgi:hypothetical protein
MTAVKQQESIDEFRDSCSVQLQVSSSDRVAMICGRSSHVNRVCSPYSKRAALKNHKAFMDNTVERSSVNQMLDKARIIENGGKMCLSGATYI